MRIGSLFSGIGGLELGLETAGLGQTVWQVEQNPACNKVLARHWPDATRFGDVRHVGAHNLEPVDLICGGFPCQDLSSAGARKGLTGSRSGLWREFARVVGELKPPWVVVENVSSGAARWVDPIVATLEGWDYHTLPVPLSAEDVGAPHSRPRVFIIARLGNADSYSKSMGPLNAEAPVVQGTPRQLPGWAELPSIRVADGVPGGMAMYGNAVVPRCAEVIGWMIRELEGAV